MPDTLVDNDIVLKLCRFGHLNDLAACLGHDAGGLAVLGSLRFKIGGMLTKDAIARTAFEAFLPQVEEAEPSEAEVLLAAQMEEAALQAGHAVNGGESLLFAMAVTRAARVATGDKRAVEGLAAISDAVPACRALVGAVVTLEWVASALVARRGLTCVRAAVCAKPQVDRALCACFQCHRDACTVDDVHAALSSYQGDLARRTAGFVGAALSPAV